MHFILHVRVWLHQGFRVNPTFLHNYGQCCRMSNPNKPDDATSGSHVPSPPDTGRQGPQMRQQITANTMETAAEAAAAQAAPSLAPAASQGAQSVTATIDNHSLATAMSRLNDDSASSLDLGTQPKWDFKSETVVDWQHEVEIWVEL